jgi:glycosyltransferase involved in cell wall biosynthesis
MSGSGMKLRVAEALSLGIPVVGTKCGLKGYDDIGTYGFSINDIPEMARVIRQLLTDDHTKLIDMSCAARSAWSSKYSFEAFSNRIQSVADNMHINT